MFYEEIVNNFLNSEQKIIYTEKRVSKFFKLCQTEKYFMPTPKKVYVESGELFL